MWSFAPVLYCMQFGLLARRHDRPREGGQALAPGPYLGGMVMKPIFSIPASRAADITSASI